MKNLKSKIILLILAVSLIGLLGGCDDPTQYIYNKSDYIIKEASVTDNHGGKYKYIFSDGGGDIVLYSNDKFSVGDTLVIRRK